MVFLVVMGVCGCGKTTMAQQLGQKLQWRVVDGDEFHSEGNKRKMNQGTPLTDEDRLPWLLEIHKYIAREDNEGHHGIVACSALKKSYRRILATGSVDEAHASMTSSKVVFVHLQGPDTLIQTRLAQRGGHFMAPSLLQSQLATLEKPETDENCIVADIQQTPTQMVEWVVSKLDPWLCSDTD